MDVFDFKVSSNRCLARCGVDVYQGRESSVVVVTELPDNPGMSICNAFEDLFPQVCRKYALNPEKVLWIEYWGRWRVADGAPYDRKEEEWLKVYFQWDGNRVRDPKWQRWSESLVKLALDSI